MGDGFRVYICDTHTHSRFSFDGCETADAMCEAAIKEGLNGIVITDHYDIDGIEDGFYPPFDREAARVEIEEAKQKYQGRIDVFRGVELGQPYTRPDHAKQFLKDGKFDFVLGSAHNLDGVPDFSAIDFALFNETHMLNMYIRMLREISALTDFPEIRTACHLSYPLRYMMKRAGKLPDYRSLEEEFTAVMDHFRNHEVAIELNTAGLWRKLIPAEVEQWILTLYRSRGGELVTVGSDAHDCVHVGAMIREGYELLREVGFRYVLTPAGMKPLF